MSGPVISPSVEQLQPAAWGSLPLPQGGLGEGLREGVSNREDTGVFGLPRGAQPLKYLYYNDSLEDPFYLLTSLFILSLLFKNQHTHIVKLSTQSNT